MGNIYSEDYLIIAIVLIGVFTFAANTALGTPTASAHAPPQATVLINGYSIGISGLDVRITQEAAPKPKQPVVGTIIVRQDDLESAPVGIPRANATDPSLPAEPAIPENITESPKNVTLPYVLRGEKWNMQFTAYGSMNGYFAQKPRVIYCYNDVCPPDSEYYFGFVNDSAQERMLAPLVRAIESRSDNPDDQARIAISLVQHIPYGEARADAIEYPYETVYNNLGVCGDKSLLLAHMLKELGYGVALFYYNSASPAHMNVGIKCSGEYDYRDSGYCLVETTMPVIVTDAERTYGTGYKLQAPNEIIPVSDGMEFDASDEYADASRYNQIRAMISVDNTLDSATYDEWESLVGKYDLPLGG